ncbi:MAG TPA: hypothetical protein VE987_20870, partial [Polyangiaceae bacterium]|nr:hypothetical protein [Polyangiaceae bacterium]
MTLDSSTDGGLTSPAPKRRRTLEQLVDREAKRRRRRRGASWIALGLAVLLAAAAWLTLRPRPVPLAARFRFEPASQGDVVRE